MKSIKKLLAIMLSAVMMISCLSVTASAATTHCNIDFDNVTTSENGKISIKVKDDKVVGDYLLYVNGAKLYVEDGSYYEDLLEMRRLIKATPDSLLELNDTFYLIKKHTNTTVKTALCKTYYRTGDEFYCIGVYVRGNSNRNIYEVYDTIADGYWHEMFHVYFSQFILSYSSSNGVAVADEIDIFTQYAKEIIENVDMEYYGHGRGPDKTNYKEYMLSRYVQSLSTTDFDNISDLEYSDISTINEMLGYLFGVCVLEERGEELPVETYAYDYDELYEKYPNTMDFLTELWYSIQ